MHIPRYCILDVSTMQWYEMAGWKFLLSNNELQRIMLNVLAIMIGGGLGATFRYGLFLIIHRTPDPAFPSGTLAANLLGSLFIGFLWQMFEGTKLTHEWRLFIFTGFLGGFTTFSTFTRETTQLLKVGEWKTALTYMLLSNGLGIALVICGYLLARRFISLPK